jgi:hydrogenase maturation factor HypF (carbamoyltransferase family)
MKPGTPIAGLDFMKNEDPVVSKERSEYPEWVNNLATPMPSLAKLKKMSVEETDESEQYRFLKLTRRNLIKDANTDAGLR